jgi:hypothetical protein
MFKEILHYTFRRSSRAFDISAFHQHGSPFNIGFSKDGAEHDSGAYVFNGQNSRVQVPYGEVWQELGALKVEALVRLDTLGVRHNLVEGFLSFALFVRGDGRVTGSFLAPKNSAGPGHSASNSLVGTILVGGGSPDPFATEAAVPPDTGEPEIELAWMGVNSTEQFAPDGITRTISVGAWTRLTLIHNGFSLQLWLDDELAGYREDIDFPVLDVQPGGVHIGAWPSSNTYVLNGALDEIRIWKFDPFHRESQFFCRPMDAHTEVCWRALLNCLLDQWLDPESSPQVEKVVDCLDEAERDFWRAIERQGTQAINQSMEFSHRYDALWCEGKIDGPEMAELLKTFADWIQEVGGEALDVYMSRILTCRQDLQALGCDDEFRCIAENDRDWRALGELSCQHGLRFLCSPLLRSEPTRPERPYPSKRRY